MTKKSSCVNARAIPQVPHNHSGSVQWGYPLSCWGGGVPCPRLGYSPGQDKDRSTDVCRTEDRTLCRTSDRTGIPPWKGPGTRDQGQEGTWDQTMGYCPERTWDQRPGGSPLLTDTCENSTFPVLWMWAVIRYKEKRSKRKNIPSSGVCFQTNPALSLSSMQCT